MIGKAMRAEVHHLAAWTRSSDCCSVHMHREIVAAAMLLACIAGGAWGHMTKGNQSNTHWQSLSLGTQQLLHVIGAFAVCAIVAGAPCLLFTILMLGACVVAILLPIAGGVVPCSDRYPHKRCLHFQGCCG